MNKCYPCLCCSGLAYSECCAPSHQGKEASTALILMRSRYCAYALKKANYIQKTTHHQSPYFEKNRVQWSHAILEFCTSTTFVKLQILDLGDNWISFAAYLQQGVKPLILFEKSLFKREGPFWRYLKGETRVEQG